jgi:hypothetical protein
MLHAEGLDGRLEGNEQPERAGDEDGVVSHGGIHQPSILEHLF